MGMGTTTTLGFLNDEGNWVPVSEANPVPIAGDGAGGEPPVAAGLNTLGFLQGIFIENGGTIPPEAVSPYVVVIEQE